MKYYNNILETIGDTPLIKLHKTIECEALVLAKVETFNPGHSIKDRMALKMIEDADRIGVDVIQLGPTDPMEMTQDICVNESNREIFEENFELARLRAEELGVNIQLLKGF